MGRKRGRPKKVAAKRGGIDIQQDMGCTSPTPKSDNSCENNVYTCLNASSSNMLNDSVSSNARSFPEDKNEEQIKTVVLDSIGSSQVNDKETCLADFSNILMSIIDTVTTNEVTSSNKNERLALSSVINNVINDQSLQPVVMVHKLNESSTNFKKNDLTLSKNKSTGSCTSVERKSSPLKNEITQSPVKSSLNPKYKTTDVKDKLIIEQNNLISLKNGGTISTNIKVEQNKSPSIQKSSPAKGKIEYRDSEERKMPAKTTNSQIRSSKKKKCSDESIIDIGQLCDYSLLNEIDLSELPKHEKMQIETSPINENTSALMSHNNSEKQKHSVSKTPENLSEVNISSSKYSYSLFINEKERNELISSNNDMPVLKNYFSCRPDIENKDLLSINDIIVISDDDDVVDNELSNKKAVNPLKLEENDFLDEIIPFGSKEKIRKRIFVMSSDESDDPDYQIIEKKNESKKFRKSNFIIKKVTSRNNQNNPPNSTINKSSPNTKLLQSTEVSSIEPDIISSCKTDLNSSNINLKERITDGEAPTVNNSDLDNTSRLSSESANNKNILSDETDKIVEEIDKFLSSTEEHVELNKSIKSTVDSPSKIKIDKCDSDKLKANVSQVFADTSFDATKKEINKFFGATKEGAESNKSVKSTVDSSSKIKIDKCGSDKLEAGTSQVFSDTFDTTKKDSSSPSCKNLVNQKDKSKNEKRFHKSNNIDGKKTDRQKDFEGKKTQFKNKEKDHESKKSEKHKFNARIKGSDVKTKNSDEKQRKKSDEKQRKKSDEKQRKKSDKKQGKKSDEKQKKNQVNEKSNCGTSKEKSHHTEKLSTSIRDFKVNNKLEKSKTSDSLKVNKELNSKTNKKDNLNQSVRIPTSTPERNHSKPVETPVISDNFLKNKKTSSDIKNDSVFSSSKDLQIFSSASKTPPVTVFEDIPASIVSQADTKSPLINGNNVRHSHSRVEDKKTDSLVNLNNNKFNSLINNDKKALSRKPIFFSNEKINLPAEVNTLSKYPCKIPFGKAHYHQSLLEEFNEVYAFEFKTQLINGCEMLSVPTLDLIKDLRDIVSSEKINVNQKSFSSLKSGVIKVPHVRKLNSSDCLSTFCSKLLNNNYCDIGESCTSDHKFTESMWCDLNDFNKWWSHIEQLLKNCVLINCDVFTSICLNLLKLKKRNKLLTLGAYLAKRETDSNDYLREMWSTVLSALEQTGVQKLNAIQSILQHICSLQPSLPIEEIHNILLYLGVESENYENIWEIYENVRDKVSPLLPKLFNTILSIILKNPFRKPESSFVTKLLLEIKNLPTSYFSQIDNYRFEKFYDFLVRNNMLSQEIAFSMNEIKKAMLSTSKIQPLIVGQKKETSQIHKINNENRSNVNSTSDVQLFDSKVISCLQKKTYEELFIIIETYCKSPDIVYKMSSVILKYFNKLEEWLLILKDLYGCIVVKRTCVNLMEKILEFVSTSLISDLIDNEKWKSAYSVYNLRCSFGFMIPAGVFAERGMSQVRRIILCCELCWRNDDLLGAVSLIMDHELHLDYDRWTVDSKLEDVGIVRKAIFMLINCFISKISSKNDCKPCSIVFELLGNIISNQRSIHTPFDVSELFEDFIIKLIDVNNCDKAKRFYFDVISMVQLKADFSITFCRVALILSYRHEVEAKKLFDEGVSLNIYPSLKGLDYTIQVYSYWRREEMVIYLDQWFQQCARQLYNSKKSPMDNFTFQIQIKSLSFFDEKRRNKSLPKILGNPIDGIKDARRRIQRVMTELNPPLLVNFSNEEGLIELDSSTVKDMLIAKIKLLEMNSLRLCS